MRKFLKTRWRFYAVILCVLVLVSILSLNVNLPQNYNPLLTIGGKEVTITIGNPSYAAGVADYSCDGTDDNVQFQTALNALPISGGKLVILTGNYNFSLSVTRIINNVTIQGTGFGTYIARNGVDVVFATGGTGWKFQDLAVDAGGINDGGTAYFENIKIGAAYYAQRLPSGANFAGNLTGDVTGNLTGNVSGNLSGDVTGDLTGDVSGNLTGNVSGNVTGNLTGDVTGNLTGNVTGNLTGDVTGNADTATTANGLSIAAGAAAGKVLTSDGSGVGSWQDVPIPSMLDMFGINNLFYCSDFESFTEVVTGTGATTIYNYGRMYLTTGATAGSTAIRFLPVDLGSLATLNWDQPFWIQFSCTLDTSGGAATKYAYLKLALDYEATNLSTKGVGIRFNRNGLALQGQVHNGAALKTVELGALPNYDGTISSGASVIRIVYVPATSVTFYSLSNGAWSNLGSITSGLPTGISSSGLLLSMSVNNAASNSAQTANLSNVIICREFK